MKEKLNQAQMKSAEDRNENESLKKEMKMAQKVTFLDTYQPLIRLLEYTLSDKNLLDNIVEISAW